MSFISTANARRPQVFDTLLGQDFVVKTIENSIKTGRFAHAYLFAGPRGVGKTTSARLLAKALNCEQGPTSKPCGKCASCTGITTSSSIDCIEIDGASNTSVDDIRKIKTDIMYPPAVGKFKIYIIDEVHMLSISAFNALLKTIEEPPEYIIFIFATTELQKVPATIKSRCQLFTFKAISSETIIQAIKGACKDNKIKIDEQTLLWLSKEAGGSMRDAYTLYDQLVSFCGNDIKFEKVKETLHLSSSDTLLDIYKSAYNGDKNKCLELYLTLRDGGVTNQQFLSDFAELLRSIMLFKNGVTREDLLYYPVSFFDVDEIKKVSTSKIELLLDECFSLYRNLKDSVNPDFEMELFVSSLAELQHRYSNFEIAKRLSELKSEIEQKSSFTSSSVQPSIEASSSSFQRVVPPSTPKAETAKKTTQTDISTPTPEKQTATKVLPSSKVEATSDVQKPTKSATKPVQEKSAEDKIMAIFADSLE